MNDLSAWRKYRETSVTQPLGDLALVAMYLISGPTQIEGIPGQWRPTQEKKAGLTLKASKEDKLFCDGMLIDGELELEADETTVVINNDVVAVATEQPGSLHLLAIYNKAAEAVKSFNAIDCYEENLNWVLEGDYVLSEQQTYSFSHTADQGNDSRIHQSLGEIHVWISGKLYQLRPFMSGDVEIIVFRDGTSGKETYGMGRMLIVEKAEDGKVKLDFNRAFLPPCAFSPYFNCPMPPASNIITTAIKAGEKQVLFRE